MKILIKILLPLLATVAIGLFVSTLLTYQMSTNALEDASASAQKMAIANAIIELETGLEFNVLNAISLAQTGLFQPYLAGPLELRFANEVAVQERLMNMRNTYYYVMLGVLDLDGIVLRHTEPFYVGKDFSNQSFFKEAIQGKVAIGNPFLYNDMVVYVVASPVYDIQTKMVIGVVFNVSRLTNTMQERMYLGEKGYVLVADSAGLVFIHNDQEKVLTLNLNDTDWGREMLASKSGELFFEKNGAQKLAYYDMLTESSWLAVAVADVGELKAPSLRIRNNAILISIVILFLLAGLVYMYVNNIVKALLKAVRYAEQVAAGVLDKDLDLQKDDQAWLDTALKNLSKALRRVIPKDTEGEGEQLPTEKGDTHGLNQFARDDEIGVLYHALQAMVDAMRGMVHKSDEASKLKTEFLANMSHEIRTPLNAVIGMAHLYLESDGNSEKKREYVSKIHISAKILLGIINNVLDVSKIEAGMFELDCAPFSLREVGEQIIVIHQSNAATKKLDLLFTFDPHLPEYVLGDPVRLGQVLNNLIGNALKFTEKGSVHLSFASAEPSMSETKVQDGVQDDTQDDTIIPVLITVSDTGLGIPAEQIDRLFKPFMQGDASITRRFGGTGLGLAISERIIHLMGAKFTVKSVLGEGTTFSFEVPLLRGKDLQGSMESDSRISKPDLTGKRILVAEDNEMNQLLMEELLQSTGAEVVLAENGLRALELVKEQAFDLVLMDMQMPVMDGIQAAREIRKIASFDALPIIAVTANAMKADKDESMLAGLNDYITKPIEPTRLMLVLKMWLLEK